MRLLGLVAAAIGGALVGFLLGLGVANAVPPEQGIASFVGPRFGPTYLALPAGPGIRVRICAADGSPCVNRTSTDAGPDLEMQRAGRVADVSFADFRTLCGCDPWVRGTMPVLVHYGPRATLPATDAP